MTDILSELAAVHRETARRPVPAGEARTVVLRREYDAAIEDVWDAITDPQRLRRWFLPVTGDLRLGGRYQLQGNAGGEIVRCEPPRLLTVTWIFGEEPKPGEISEVEVRLSTGAGGGTVLELEHAASVPAERWAQYGPGATGVGWDLTLLGLAMHLRGEHLDDPDAWVRSTEAREFITRSSRAWGAAMRDGGASDEEAATAERNTTAFYAP
ncbi:MAG TPA: SRPBCC family protein [Micromonosporaceae bacterium]